MILSRTRNIEPGQHQDPVYRPKFLLSCRGTSDGRRASRQGVGRVVGGYGSQQENPSFDRLSHGNAPGLVSQGPEEIIGRCLLSDRVPRAPTSPHYIQDPLGRCTRREKQTSTDDSIRRRTGPDWLVRTGRGQEQFSTEGCFPTRSGKSPGKEILVTENDDYAWTANPRNKPTSWPRPRQGRFSVNFWFPTRDTSVPSYRHPSPNSLPEVPDMNEPSTDDQKDVHAPDTQDTMSRKYKC